jgi:hypothetical protein
LIEDSLILGTTTTDEGTTYYYQYLGYIRGSYGVMDMTLTNAGTPYGASADTFYPCFN